MPSPRKHRATAISEDDAVISVSDECLSDECVSDESSYYSTEESRSPSPVKRPKAKCTRVLSSTSTSEEEVRPKKAPPKAKARTPPKARIRREPPRKPLPKRKVSTSSEEPSESDDSYKVSRAHIPSFPIYPINYKWLDKYIGDVPYSSERENGIDTLMRYKQHAMLYVSKEPPIKDLLEWLKLAYRLKYNIECDEGDVIVLISIPELGIAYELDTNSLNTKFKGLDLFSRTGEALTDIADIEARREQLLTE